MAPLQPEVPRCPKTHLHFVLQLAGHLVATSFAIQWPYSESRKEPLTLKCIPGCTVRHGRITRSADCRDSAAERAHCRRHPVYEKQGLLVKAPRTAGGLRLYTEGDLRPSELRCSSAVSRVSLHEIGELLVLRDSGPDACIHIRDLLRERLSYVEARIKGLRRPGVPAQADTETVRRCRCL